MTQETKHTPGPWEKVWEQQEDGTYPVQTVDEWKPIAWVMGEANAHLIAAAPDLLRLLENMVFLEQGMDSALRKEIYEEAADLIKEIRGE